MGRPFQSPFAKPPGQGLSSSTVNVLWGFFNIVIGYVLVCRVGDFDLQGHQRRRRARLGRAGDGACFGAGVRPLQRRQCAGASMTAPLTGVFRSLRGFNYRVWAAGAFVSNVGTWMQRTAQDWLVFTQLTASQRLGGRRGHGAAVRAAAAAAALDGLRGRPFQPAQAADRHPGDDGRARAGAGHPDRHRRSSSSGMSMSSPSCSAARRRSTRRCARPSSPNWWATRICTTRWRSTRPRSTPRG